LRCRLEVDCREFQVLNYAGVNEVDDPPTVKHVSGEAVGVPGEDARCFALLDPLDHLIEHPTARLLGALLFEQHVDDIEPVFRRKLANLGQLILDTADLTVLVIGRFTGVYEEFGRCGIHLVIISIVSETARTKWPCCAVKM